MICKDVILHTEPNCDEQSVSKKERLSNARHLVQSFSKRVMLLPGDLSSFRLGVLVAQHGDFLLRFGDELFFLTEVPAKY